MPIIPAGFGQVNYKLKLIGDVEPMMVTMGVDFDTILEDPLQQIVNDLDFVFFDAFINDVSQSYDFLGATLYANVAGGNLVIESNVGVRAFSQAGSALPQNCAYLIKKQTERGGRQGRGRMYLPGVIESSCDATGTVLEATVTSLQASADAFLTALSTVGGIAAPVLLHTAPGEPPDEVTSLRVDTRIATQRRRLR